MKNKEFREKQELLKEHLLNEVRHFIKCGFIHYGHLPNQMIFSVKDSPVEIGVEMIRDCPQPVYIIVGTLYDEDHRKKKAHQVYITAEEYWEIHDLAADMLKDALDNLFKETYEKQIDALEELLEIYEPETP